MTNKNMWPYNYKSCINENTTPEELIWKINDHQNAQFSGYCDAEEWDMHQEAVKYLFEVYRSKI